MESDQKNNTGNAQYDQAWIGQGKFKGRGIGGGYGRGREQIIIYNYGQQGHFARDYTNPTTTYKYCRSFDHVVEDCPIFQVKWQEKRQQVGNPSVQLIGAKHHESQQKLNIVMRSGLAIDGSPLDIMKKSAMDWVRRSAAKSPTFDLQKEKEMFLQAQREFCDAKLIRVEEETREIDDFYKMTITPDDYINPTTDGMLIWHCSSSCTLHSKGLKNQQIRQHEVSRR